MSNEIVPRTRLECRIAQDEPALDLDTDLYVCMCTDGFVIYSPTASECNAARMAYERIAATVGRARTWGGGLVWAAQDSEYQQFFGATRGEAIASAMRGNAAASEAAHNAACNAAIEEMRAEGAQ